MEEKTPFEEVVAYAQRNDMTFFTHEGVEKFHLIPNLIEGKTKFVVLDLNDRLEGLYFIYYYSHKEFSKDGNMYSGLYFKTEKNKKSARIVNRYWFSALSFKKRIKSGWDEIDRELSFYADEGSIDFNFINSNFLLKFIKLSKKIAPLSLNAIVESNSIIPQLKHHNWMAIRTNNWLTEAKDIEMMVDDGIQLFEKLH